MRFLLIFFIIISAFCYTAHSSTNQGRITGSLIDSLTSKPIPFVTVSLNTADGKTITGTLAGDDGTFTIENVVFGTYQLALTLVGYRSKKIVSLTISPEKPAVHVGTILLIPEPKLLSEVKVVGQKALVERKNGHIVYNAERDASTSGGTAADVLRKTPMVTVEPDGNLTMRGSSSIKVLVNGKPSAIMASNLADAIKQMPASIIKSVEVITNPGAKYDAEGVAGVINIITKKALTGKSGQVTLAGGNLNSSVGINLNLQGDKLGVNVVLNGNQKKGFDASEGTRTTLLNDQPVNVLKQTYANKSSDFGEYSVVSLDYDPDSLNRINLSATFSGGKARTNSSLFSRLMNVDGTIEQEYNRNIQVRSPTANTEYNLSWMRTYQKSGREFSVLTQYSRMPGNPGYTVVQTPVLAEVPDYLERSQSKIKHNEYTFQTDYIDPFMLPIRQDTLSITLETGLKGVSRKTGTLSTVEQAMTGKESDYQIAPDRSAELNYGQRILAGYLSLRVETGNQWALTLGGRYEHTQISSDNLSVQTQFKGNYHNLIPTVNLSKTINEKHTIEASYTQRISRPQIEYLNPFKNYSDSKNVSVGNPDLQAELAHATELTYSMYDDKGTSLSTTLYWRQTNNAIEWLKKVNTEGVALSTPQNIGQEARFGGSWYLSFLPAKDLTVTVNNDLSYNSLVSPSLSQRNSGWLNSGGLVISYKLPKDWYLEGSWYYTTGWLYIQSRYKGYTYLNLTGKKEFMQKKAALTLRLGNPFKKYIILTGHSKAPTYVSDGNNAYVYQSFNLSFSYKFGHVGVKEGKKNKKIINDDKKQASKRG
ncbi:outer membrane beta-barrel family protein [Arsenicibacter rosenii]|uniref:TonB-dependent receptor n=1 Tax=Arsenicibacter rosenii TaxID=1750698 RepID=A0A1S2VCT4_9BACT|nr:outer membrane beta-barrel family protein [Arsenicibacter rosenii]OIN56125.1 TonB-dependent receptor [Arsenicibacter rosenii]